MNFDFTNADRSFDDAINYLKQEYLQISTGRANPSLLDGVVIDSYGSMQAIKNIASINLEDARTMKISPWDKSQVQAIEKGLYDSQLPFSVSVDADGVRVSIPQLTEESKLKIVKLVKEKLEEARVKVRNVRQDTIKLIEAKEKEGEYGEDARKQFKDDLQKKVDKVNAQLEELFDAKEAAVMKV